MEAATLIPVQTDEIERHRGQWVALARDDEHVVASAESLDELYEILGAQAGEPRLIQRIPNVDEPIYVGLG